MTYSEKDQTKIPNKKSKGIDQMFMLMPTKEMNYKSIMTISSDFLTISNW